MALFVGSDSTWEAWRDFEYSVRSGKSSFEHVHGMGFFDFIQRHADEGRHFDEAMTGFSAQEIDAIHRAYDFSSKRNIVDIAGGHGALLISCLKRNPAQRGILFDLPVVIDGAKATVAAAGLVDRCELVGGDFFKSVPSGADAYVMKHILHDWDDEHSSKILECVRAATKPGTRLVIIDAVIQPGNQPAFAKLMDLEMLVLYKGGRERTQAEFSSLLAGTGFKLERVVPTDSTASVIEAVRV